MTYTHFVVYFLFALLLVWACDIDTTLVGIERTLVPRLYGIGI